MLRDWPSNERAQAAKPFRDITEREPVPKGAIVDLIDWCPNDGEDGIWYVEYLGCIYAATPDELSGI